MKDNWGMKMEKYLKSDEEGHPKVFAVSSLKEFVELAMSLSECVIFRGQTKGEGWPLIPSAGRDSDHSLIPWNGHERQVLEEFTRESIPYLDHHLPTNDWQWLALAQHNRLPTRLLDWTKNPLVALWFAVKDPPVDHCPGLVWVLYYTDLKAVFNTKGEESESPFDIDYTRVYFPEHMYPSIQAQSSVFTVHHRKTASNPAEFPSLESTRDSALILKKMEVPAHSFKDIRDQLFRVGISPASLFPGLRGIAGKIRYVNMLCQDEGRA